MLTAFFQVEGGAKIANVMTEQHCSRNFDITSLSATRLIFLEMMVHQRKNSIKRQDDESC